MNQASNEPEPEFLTDQLKVALPRLTKSEARIAQWLILNEQAAIMETGASLAAKAGVSEITVGRFMRAFGLNGMVGLRDKLKGDILARQISADSRRQRLLSSPLGNILRAEAEAVLALSAQFDSDGWAGSLAKLASARSVHVTGFQSIRGLAEDFARRMSILRPQVRFVSAHDGMLAEWVDLGPEDMVVLFDITPYAREAAGMVQLARDRGADVLVITDEMNAWAGALTPHVLHAHTKVGAYLESTGPLAVAANLILHQLAGALGPSTARRLAEWPNILKKADLF
jgi:DNA-binding MurR/RpiR family transcriptional regulator